MDGRSGGVRLPCPRTGQGFEDHHGRGRPRHGGHRPRRSAVARHRQEGQNVRLASRLTGWKLDVRSESEAEDEARRARTSLTAIPGLGDVAAELLYQRGFKSAEELAESDDDTVSDVEGIDPERAPSIIAAAREHVIRKREEEAAAAARKAEEDAAAARKQEEDALAAQMSAPSDEGGDGAHAGAEPLAKEEQG